MTYILLIFALALVGLILYFFTAIRSWFYRDCELADEELDKLLKDFSAAYKEEKTVVLWLDPTNPAGGGIVHHEVDQKQ